MRSFLAAVIAFTASANPVLAQSVPVMACDRTGIGSVPLHADGPPVIVDGRVFVNDRPLFDDYVPDAYRSHDEWGPETIPEGYYFVLGDRRANSSDSRQWRFVPERYIVGKVQLRWWPVPAARNF
jgi:hypothetical protein